MTYMGILMTAEPFLLIYTTISSSSRIVYFRDMRI